MPLLIIMYLLSTILCCLQQDVKKGKSKIAFSFQILVSPIFQLWKGFRGSCFGKDVQDLSKILWDVASGGRSHSVMVGSIAYCPHLKGKEVVVVFLSRILWCFGFFSTSL